MEKYSALRIAEIVAIGANKNKAQYPTAEQQEIIESALESMLVIAGAGSGKTQTMADRIVYLVANEIVHIDEILGLTFTNKAVLELKNRIVRQFALFYKGLAVSGENISAQQIAEIRPKIATYNSFASKIVDEYAELDSENSKQNVKFRTITDAMRYKMVNDMLNALVRDGELTFGDLANSIGEPYSKNSVINYILSLSDDLGNNLLTADVAISELRKILEHFEGTDKHAAKYETLETMKTANSADYKKAVNCLFENYNSRGKFNFIDALPVDKDGNRILAKKGSSFNFDEILHSFHTRIKILELVKVYQKRKEERRMIEFSDQVMKANELVVKNVEISREYSEKYKVVILDEYQDTSPAQAQLLRKTFTKNHPVTAVGDPNQAIYSWRGASVSGILEFPDRFKLSDGSRAHIKTLSKSWRNPEHVLRVANKIAEPLYEDLRHNFKNHSLKELQSKNAISDPEHEKGKVLTHFFQYDDDEAAYVANYLKEHFKNGKTAAILLRARADFDLFATELENAEVPYEIVGLGGLLTQPDVLDIRALMAISVNHDRNDLLLRLLTGAHFRIGARELRKIYELYIQKSHDLKKMLAEYTKNTELLQKIMHEFTLIDFISMFSKIYAKDCAELLPETVKRLIKLSNWIVKLREIQNFSIVNCVLVAQKFLSLDLQDEPKNIDAFINWAFDYESDEENATVHDFIDFIELVLEHENGLDMPVMPLDKSKVQLITIHGAKGLEWDIVLSAGNSHGRFFAGSDAREAPAVYKDCDIVNTEQIKNGGLRYQHAPNLANFMAKGKIPENLRLDSNSLPHFAFEESVNMASRDFYFNEYGLLSSITELKNDRRLAYVAFTRSAGDLIITGSWFTRARQPKLPNSEERKKLPEGMSESEFIAKSQKPIDAPSVFMLEAIQLLYKDNPERAIVEEHPTYEEVKKQRREKHKNTLWTGSYATKLQETVFEKRKNLAKALEPALSDNAFTDKTLTELAEIAQNDGLSDLAFLTKDLIATENAITEFNAGKLSFNKKFVSPSDEMKLAENRFKYAKDAIRPVPERIIPEAALGTKFHEWVDLYYASKFGTSREKSAAKSALTKFNTSNELQKLIKKFENSEFYDTKPLAIEHSYAYSTADGGLTGAIDAVFPTENDGEILILDWKTYKKIPSAKHLKAMILQLEQYKNAWLAEHPSQDAKKVKLAFYFVAQGETRYVTE
ncbi:MAG: ATP-dependent helicase [Bifidobacteriaceae bacterium]|jgi:DNA helicase-2/ATP-dependent DNA helicase PcrA|nr:ATP-dependent helicase [Bifidobacteriaceae bacterium]